MNLLNLIQYYQKQDNKRTTSSHKTHADDHFCSVKNLQLKGSFLLEEQTIVTREDKEVPSLNYLIQQEVHYSIYSKTKRLIDLFGSLLGLLFTATLLVPISVAIKIDSSGSIFYSQVRCGLLGRPFRIWKFRTMCVDAEKQQHLIKNEVEGHIFKNQNDPRITRVGKFLRKTSLDELPQFWNVFKGDMSLVGTRPPTPDEVKNYHSYHYQRLLVKPGITGEWQVYGRSSVKNFDEIVRLDLEYQNKWSPMYDIKLILKTIKVVLFSEGAY